MIAIIDGGAIQIETAVCGICETDKVCSDTMDEYCDFHNTGPKALVWMVCINENVSCRVCGDLV